MKGGQRVLVLEVPLTESFDEERMEFVTSSAIKLELEHSLVSLSKWEAKFEKPFLSNTEKTSEESLWYIKCMTLTPDVPPEVFSLLTEKHIKEISDYINGKQTATWFRDDPSRPRSHEVITGEIIYYWMLSLNINIEAENWHLNRLITLIRVVQEKNAPPKKRTRTEQADLARQRRELNEQRRRQFASNG